MQYANYEYYVSCFLGNLIPANSFSRCATQASRFLDYYTMGKSKCDPAAEELKMACCAVAEQYFLLEKSRDAVVKSMDASGGLELQSESVGSYSRTFRSNADNVSSTLDNMTLSRAHMANAARQYLSGTRFLYRGRC